MVSTSVPQFSSFSSLTDIKALVDNITSATGTLTKGSTATIDGQPAIGITDSSTGGVLYVATTGPAYPLQLKLGKGKGQVDFTDWDQPVTLTAPAHPVDYAKLTGG